MNGLIKAGDETTVATLIALWNKVWHLEIVLTVWENSVIVSLP